MTEAKDIISLIKQIHAARDLKNEGERENKRLTEVIKKYLRTLPEGEQEAWDMEANPPIGVALETKGGRRWADTTLLSDETLLFMIRKGIFVFNPTVYDAIKDVPDAEGVPHFLALAKAIKEGGSEKLIMLPKRGQQ